MGFNYSIWSKNTGPVMISRNVKRWWGVGIENGRPKVGNKGHNAVTCKLNMRQPVQIKGLTKNATCALLCDCKVFLCETFFFSPSTKIPLSPYVFKPWKNRVHTLTICFSRACKCPSSTGCSLFRRRGLLRQYVLSTVRRYFFTHIRINRQHHKSVTTPTLNFQVI
jgi:hypothetical protein